MSVAKKIFKNTAWLTTAEIVNGILMFFIAAWLARYLEPTRYGKLGFALNFVAFFSIIVDLGLGNLAIREIARNLNSAKKFLSSILTLRIFLGFVSFILLFIIAQFLNKDKEVLSIVYILGLMTIINTLASSFYIVIRSFEKMEYEALTKILNTILLVSLLSYSIITNASLTKIAAVYLICTIFVFFFVALIIWFRFSHFGFHFDKKFYKFLIKESWPFALSAIFITIYYSMDSVMLGLMGKDQDVGWYTAAYKIIFFLLTLSSFISISIFPVLSKLFKESIDQLQDFSNKFQRLSSILAVPLVFGGVIIAQKIIKFVFGDSFLNSALAFQILLFAVAVVFVSGIYSNILQACNRQKIFMIGVSLGALTNIIFNFLLIPKFSLYGAAVATFLAEFVLTVFMYFKANKIVKVKLMPYLLKPVISSIIMAAILLYLSNLNFFLLIFLGGVIYFFSMCVIKGINKFDFLFLKKIVLNK